MLPVTAFGPPRISAPKRFRSPALVLSLCLATAFRSPTTAVFFRRPPSRGQRSPPAASASIPNRSPTRSNRDSRPHFAFAHTGPITIAIPLPNPLSGTPAPSLARTPLRDFHPSGSTCSPRLVWEARLHSRSDRRLLPACGPFLSFPPADHRSQLAAVREACCSF